MTAALMGVVYKGAELFIIALAAGISLFGGTRSVALVPPPPAAAPLKNVAQAALIMPVPPIAGTAAITFAPTATAAVAPGLLPKVTLLKKPEKAAVAPVKAASASAATVPPPQSPQPRPTTAPRRTATFTTADEVLAHTTTTLVRRIGGSYGLTFNVVSGGATVLSWQYGAATIGGTNGIPPFAADYNCNPPPMGQANPLFAVRTDYACTVSLTALTGSDKRTRSAPFTFATGFGEFFASPPANMNTHLTNDENDGGFVFTNEDSKPVSVLSETFTVSYAGLITAYGPLVLRLVDPANAANYIDYHLENIPAVASSSYLHIGTGITLSMPLTVGAANAKMLPVEVLGVHKLSVAGVNPTVSVTLAGIATDRNDIDLELGAPQISWSCVIATGYYDPNATSGPYATGEACQN